MTTAQLRLLRVFCLQLGADAVQELDIALLRILLQCGDKGPGHGARGLAGDLSVLAVELLKSVPGVFDGSGKCKEE